MRPKPSILNSNNNINCIISPAANVNAAATAAIKHQIGVADKDDIADTSLSCICSQKLIANSHSESEEFEEICDRRKSFRANLRRFAPSNLPLKIVVQLQFIQYFESKSGEYLPTASL